MQVANTEPRPSQKLPFVKACELSVQPPDEQWLIRSLWGREAVGVIGGSPKVGKSWFGLDMATSVASGTSCLGRFPVDDPGPALVYLAEDAIPIVRARLDALCLHRGIDIRKLDLHVITVPSLHIDAKDDQELLEATVAHLKPRLLLLDPLVRIHTSDENDARQMSGLLGFLRELQRTHHLAVVLVHHASKRYRTHPGQGLRGSGDIYAFGDCNLYLVRREGRIQLTIEHRAARSPEPVFLELVSRTDGGATHLEILDDAEAREDTCQVPRLHTKILEFLGDVDTPRPGTAIRAHLKVNNKKLFDALKELELQGYVKKTPKGWLASIEEQPRLPFR